MINVIRMELYRMFKTRSFYVTAALCMITVTLLLYTLAPSINAAFEGQSNSEQIKEEVLEDVTVQMNLSSSDIEVLCPSNICSEFMALSCLFVAIFMACFIGNFYKDGFCKNVVSGRRHRYYFQAAKAVCALVYAAIVLVLMSCLSIVVAKSLIHSFEFVYMGEFAKFLLGEYCLLSVIGLASAFVTELCHSKIPAIVYILLTSTNITPALISTLDNKLSDWFSRDILVENYLPSLYQLNFQTEVPSNIDVNNQALLHAVVLSAVFFVIYNVAGAALISKRDVK